MGLDMYLSASKYIGNWNHDDAKERAVYKSIVDAIGLPGFSCEGSPHLTVNICVAYWRKSNQIHAWFVENCQDGEDKCQKAYVSRERLETLKGICDVVLQTKDATLLPPRKGFFFGSYDIDEWYWKDIENTRDTLQGILDNKALNGFEFSYQSSW